MQTAAVRASRIVSSVTGAHAAHGMITTLTVGLIGQHVLAIEIRQHDRQFLVRHRQQPRQQAVLYNAVRVRGDRR